ncbi:hypothetical protein R6Z07F_002837 [Ovis aries]
MQSERTPPGVLRGCSSPRRRRHCGAASPPAIAPRPSLPASGPLPPGLQPPRARAPTTPLRLLAPSEV